MNEDYYETGVLNMKIAVTYDNGEIFQHFGRTETFKLYEVEDGAVISSEILSAGGTGHEALAYLLADRNVNVLICGGMGGGAQAALADAGVLVCSGASGSADEAVEAYLRGELASSGVNCDHHEHEEGHSCGGGCSGCHGCGPAMEGPNVGRRVRTHYRGTFNDGTQFDSSYDRGEPLEFVCGAGMMIPGFDRAVAGMEPGQIVNVHLSPEEAYGPSDLDAIFTVEIAAVPGSENLEPGQRVYLTDGSGRPLPVTVTAKDAVTITFDANHEMAGKELNFRIELVEILD